MHPFRQLSLIEQIAEHLRQGFHSGHWCGQLPGVRHLARELAVSKATVEAALRTLESEGSLKSGGQCRRKEIVTPRSAKGPDRVLRIGLLMSASLDRINSNSQQIMLGLSRRIEQAGHICFFAEKGLTDIGHKLPLVSREVEAAKADAWVVYAAPQDVLKWFAARAIPVLAVGGGFRDLPIASSTSDASDALRAAVRMLTELGHRRIVTISPDSWRQPAISMIAGAFMTALEECGIRATNYNLPSWEATPEGLEKLLESLFLITPPTALIFVEPATYVAALGFLGLRGLDIPRDISVVSMTTIPAFVLKKPPVAHFKWPLDDHIRRIVRWVNCLAKGGTDREQATFSASFDPGGTIGQARSRSPGGS